MSDTYDLLVLGGGMAGLSVAMKCAYSGMETALVAHRKWGYALASLSSTNRQSTPTNKTTTAVISQVYIRV